MVSQLKLAGGGETASGDLELGNLILVYESVRVFVAGDVFCRKGFDALSCL